MVPIKVLPASALLSEIFPILLFSSTLSLYSSFSDFLINIITPKKGLSRGVSLIFRFKILPFQETIIFFSNFVLVQEYLPIMYSKQFPNQHSHNHVHENFSSLLLLAKEYF